MRVNAQFRGWSAAFVAGALCVVCSAASEPEDELTAATVLSFLRYSEWAPMGAADSYLSVGVLGRPALLFTFRRLLEDKSVGGRPIRVVELPPEPTSTCCQVVYLEIEKSTELKPALARFGRPLKIGVADEFIELGGDVHLLIVDGHMSFEVNRDSLERSGITISSKLLRFGQVRNMRARGPAL